MSGVIHVLDPSARAEPRAYTAVAGALVCWSPERGWLCSVDTTLPCSHTAGRAAPALDLRT